MTDDPRDMEPRDFELTIADLEPSDPKNALYEQRRREAKALAEQLRREAESE